MEFVKVGNGGRFHSAIYHRFIQSIVSWYIYSMSYINLIYFLFSLGLQNLHLDFAIWFHLQVHSTLGIDVLLDLLASKYFKYIDVWYEYAIMFSC